MVERFRTALDWEDVRVFVALARHGTLSAAARALSVNHATVSRRIAALERSVGEALVERRPDGYGLTAAGRRALEAADDMEDAAGRLARRTVGEDPSGLVRVSATPGLGQMVFAAPLARLASRHPGLDIELTGEIRSVSLERREADVALRLGRPTDGAVVVRRLTDLGFGFYASTGWRDRIADGEDPVFVGFDEGNSYLPEAGWLARCFPSARVAFRADSQPVQLAAARAGAGLAVLPHALARAAGGLARCPLAPEPPTRELWLLRRARENRDSPTRLVADAIADYVTDHREMFDERMSPGG